MTSNLYIKSGGVMVPLGGVPVASAWTELAYENDWVPHSGGGHLLAYRLFGDLLQVRGRIADGTLGLACATLPPSVVPFETGSFLGRAGANADGSYWNFTIGGSTGVIIPRATSKPAVISLLDLGLAQMSLTENS